MKRTMFRLLPIAAITSMLWACGGSNNTSPTSSASTATPASSPAPSTPAGMTLLVSRGTYDPGFVVTGALPISPAVNAVSPGTFPNVFTNDSVDANFGVTADLSIDQWAPNATSPSLYLDVTAAASATGQTVSTSFSSKSEGALNVSQDGTAITFNDYYSPIDQIDRSNSNTPGVVDSTNTDVATPTYRAVVQLNLADKSLQVTRTNAYSGNNGRASVLAGGQYYIVGNAGNSGKTVTYGGLDMLTADTGVQTIAAGSTCPFTQPIGAFVSGNSSTYTPAPAGTACPTSTTANTLPAIMGTITDSLSATTYSKSNTGGNQFGFSLAQISGQNYDKTGKDDNFRGLFLGPDGTLYVSKGSGGNGVNTVYQVGATGALANGGKLPQNAAITIVPGFTPSGWSGAPAATNLAPTTTQWTLSEGVAYPFGMWIPKSNPNLMFVADEGDTTAIASAAIGSGGLWVYQKSSSGTWTAIAHLTQGLNLGQPYTVADANGTYGTAGASYTTTPDGLRNITGQVNADGSLTIYAITSTVGNSLGTTFDEGSDSNQLVKITVNVNGSTVTPTGSGFSVMQTAPFGQVLRGVALIPTTSN